MYADFSVDWVEEESDRHHRKTDPFHDAAVKAILAHFEANPGRVYYQTQLEILFERRFYHWITGRALRELRESGQIGSDHQQLAGATSIWFYFHNRNRYWRRPAKSIKDLVLQFSQQQFTEALGRQGETLIDAGIPRFGFMPLARNAREWDGKAWAETNHDLDRVFQRDGISYGAEIKNRLSYIPRDEFNVKLRMCRTLNLLPLFIARQMPKAYILEVAKEGGFCLLMGYQFYPFAHQTLAKTVRDNLELPVDCPSRIEDGTFQRLLNWHIKRIPNHTAIHN